MTSTNGSTRGDVNLARDVAAATDAAQIETQRTVTTDANRHRVETQRGHRVHVNDTTDERTVTDETFDDRVRALIRQEDEKRQRLEDKRSIHRNRNRFLTLAGALFISFVVTYALGHWVPANVGKTFGPYAFCITIALDSAFTLYAYVKRY